MLIDITSILDQMVNDIPGSYKLQRDLKIIGLDDIPFGTFEEMFSGDTLLSDPLYGLMYMATKLHTMLLDKGDSHEEGLMRELATIMNRRLLLDYIISKRIVLDNPDLDLLILMPFAESAEDGWLDRINEIATELRTALKRFV